MRTTEKPSTRAEEVRQRRTTRTRKNPSPGSASGGRTAAPRKAGARKSSAASPPPVLVRGGMAVKVRRDGRKGKQAKRRYDIALSTPGAEMRLPALPSLHLGWRLVSGLLVIALGYLLYTAWNAPTFRVLAAEVEGLQRLSIQDINAVAGVSGEPIVTIQPEKVRQELQVAFPELSNITVEVELPARVLVTVEERQPVLAWQGDGQTVWVDESGVAFPPRGEAGPLAMVQAYSSPPGADLEASASEVTEIPELSESPQTFLDPAFVTAVLAMAEQAPENVPLVYNREHGLGWQDENGWEVYFGDDVDDIKMKLRVYKSIVKRLKKDEIQPAFISVEYVHAPYFRLER